jgi:hypothetical protein
MNKGPHDIFSLVVIFWGLDWQFKHIIVRLFKAIETFGQTLA